MVLHTMAAWHQMITDGMQGTDTCWLQDRSLQCKVKVHGDKKNMLCSRGQTDWLWVWAQPCAGWTLYLLALCQAQSTQA